MHGFGVGNYSITMMYESEYRSSRYTQLVTWEEVLNAGVDGIQIWEYYNSFCNLSESFQNRKSSNESLLQFLQTCYEELYGDRLQCAYLLFSYY